MLKPFRFDVEHLNELQRVMEDLGESCMNVGWDGTPLDEYVAQLLADARKASDMLQCVRNAVEQQIGATWKDGTFSAPSPLPAAAPAREPQCPKCGSTDGYLGTAQAYFGCRVCGREQYWTPDHLPPKDWNEAILLSPHGRKADVLNALNYERAKRAEAEARVKELEAAAATAREQEQVNGENS